MYTENTFWETPMRWETPKLDTNNTHMLNVVLFNLSLVSARDKIRGWERSVSRGNLTLSADQNYVTLTVVDSIKSHADWHRYSVFSTPEPFFMDFSNNLPTSEQPPWKSSMIIIFGANFRSRRPLILKLWSIWWRDTWQNTECQRLYDCLRMGCELNTKPEVY